MPSLHYHLAILAFVALSFTSCVSTGKYKAMQQQANQYDSLYTWSQRTLKSCQDANNDLNKQKTDMQTQMNSINLELTASKENNTQLRKQLQDISNIMSAQAESIKKSLDNMGAKDAYFMALRSAISSRDSANMVVLMDMKAMLGGFGDSAVSIKIEKGTLSVDLSDKLLFSSDSNSYTLGDNAKKVISRLARVLNDHPGVECVVEGHTDSIPSQDSLTDNWDISVKRATAVVRALQNNYNVTPVRMTAAGRSEYVTVADNDTPEGRAANRRTRIIILPHMEALLSLLEH